MLKRHSPAVAETVFPDELAQFAFDSFHFAQGSNRLHFSFIEWHRRQHPTAKRGDLVAAGAIAQPQVVARAERWVGSTSHTSEDVAHPWQPAAERIRSDIGHYMGYLVTRRLPTVDGERLRIRHLKDEKLTKDIAGLIVAQDFEYLSRENGRPRSGTAQDFNPRTDPWVSHMLWYGIMAQPTHNSDFDSLFAAIRDQLIEETGQNTVLRTNQLPPQTAKQLMFAAAVHLDHHSGHAALLPSGIEL